MGVTLDKNFGVKATDEEEFLDLADEEANSYYEEYKSRGIIASRENGNFAISLYVNLNRTTSGKDLSGIKLNELAYVSVKKQLAEENRLLLAGLSTVGNTLNNLSLKLNEVKKIFDKLDTKDYQKLTNYLGDPSKLAFFLKEPQLTLALSNFEDVQRSFEDFSESVDTSADDSKQLFTNYYSRISHSDPVVRLTKSFFRGDEFKLEKGYNKKIISVGLAQDLLKNTLSKKKFGKENDIIRLSVYKIDLLNSNVVYKPKSYLFEASRYPARVYEELRKDVTELSSIPTRNYSFTPTSTEMNSGRLTYWNETTSNFGSEYSFLSRGEKLEILENHAVSFLLENYIKITTGMLLNETVFNLDSDESEALLNEFEMSYNSKELKSGLMKIENDPFALFKASAGSFTTTKKPKLKNLKKTALLNKGMLNKVVSAAVKSEFIDTNSFVKHLIQPKKFDRIFHIIFDPEFEVDVEKTKDLMGSNPTFLDDLVAMGRLKKTFYKASGPSFAFLYKYTDVDKGPSDVSLETFFVTMESYNKDVVLKKDIFEKIPDNLYPPISLPKSPFQNSASKKVLLPSSNILKKLI